MFDPRPPPPRVPHPDDVLTEEEIEALPPGQMVDMTKELLENTFGFPIIDFPGPYLVAFTHKSVSSYYKRPSYERLEFLGDSILSFTVAKFLYDTFPEAQEGDLTKIRTRLTRSETLAYLAEKLLLDRFVYMSGKGLYRKWNRNKRILEDLMESTIGAVYLDQGLAQARNFILGLIERYIDMDDMLKDRNFKDGLLRYSHAHALPLPVYESEMRVHTDEKERRIKDFHVRVEVRGHVGYGTGKTKKSAEQEAAKDVLVKLGEKVEE